MAIWCLAQLALAVRIRLCVPDKHSFRECAVAFRTAHKLFSLVRFDIQKDYPIRVSNRTILYQHRSSALRGVLMRKIMHQIHTAVGRGMCNSNRSVSDRNKPVPFVLRVLIAERNLFHDGVS